MINDISNDPGDGSYGQSYIPAKLKSSNRIYIQKYDNVRYEK